MDIIVPAASPETVQISPAAPQQQIIVNNAGIKGDTGADGADGGTGPVGPQGPPGELTSYFDVKNYGAVGDGSTDDTAAVQAAQTAAYLNGGGVVFFPVGNYLISDSINCNTGVSFLGTGSEASIITQSDDTKPVFVGTDVASMSMGGLLLQGPSSGTANGIDLGWSAAGNLPFLHFTDLWVRDFGGSGIALQTPIVSIFERVIVQDNGAHGFDLYEAGTSCTFISCWARGNAQAGYHFFESVYMVLNGCAADNNGIGYLTESAQSIDFNGCGAEGSLTNGGDYDGYNFKIANSSVINLNSIWITDNRNIGIWVTDGSQEVKINAADNTPNGTAVAFIKTDVSTNSTIYELHNTTANDLSAGTCNIMNDGALGVQVKSFKVKDASGTLNITSASDGGDYNIFADTTGVLALYGSGGQTLNVKLLDGYLELDTLTATTVPYLDGNKRFASSAVTPTELGYVSGVSSAIQTQLNAKQSTITFGTGVQTALGVNIGSAGAPVLFNGAGGTPSSLNLSNATALPVGSITGLGSGIATFLATPSSANLASAITNETGSGALVFATSPALTTPDLGTPSALVLTNATGTPSSIGLANGTGLPVATGISGLGAGIATFLATPSSANLASAVTNETGSGALVFGTDPTISVTGGTGAINAIGQTALSLKDNTDTTKIAQFLMSSISTGTTRVYTLPNANGVLPLLGTAQSWGGVQTFTVAPIITLSNAATNTDVLALTVGVNSSGTAATGLGSQLKFTLESSTTNSQDAAAVTARWTDATHASRTAALILSTVNNAAALAEVVRFTTAGMTMAASANTIQTNSADHLVLSAGTSKLVKLTTLRQDDTANTYKVGTSVILTGWGVMTPNSSQGTETITFGVTFTQRPIVVATWGGDAATGATYGGGGNNIKGLATCKAEVITTTGFDIRIRTTDGTAWGATDLVFYQWIAIGEI